MTTPSLRIGFIGLGIMGAPMAGQLISAGHPVAVFTRSRAPAAIADSAAMACRSAREVAERSDVVFTMVPDTPDVEAVLFREDGVAAGLSPGKIVVDMSSIWFAAAASDGARRFERMRCAHFPIRPSPGRGKVRVPISRA